MWSCGCVALYVAYQWSRNFYRQWWTWHGCGHCSILVTLSPLPNTTRLSEIELQPNYSFKREIGLNAYPATQLFACKNTELMIVLQMELDTKQSVVSSHARATQTLTATRSISVQTIPSCRSKGQSAQLSSFIFCYRSKAEGPDNFKEIILPQNFAFSSVLLQTKRNQSNPTDRKYRTVLHMVASFIPK